MRERAHTTARWALGEFVRRQHDTFEHPEGMYKKIGVNHPEMSREQLEVTRRRCRLNQHIRLLTLFF